MWSVSVHIGAFLPSHELEHEDGLKGTPGFQRCILVGLVVDNFFHFFIKEQMKEIKGCFPTHISWQKTGTGLVKQPCARVVFMFMFIEVCGCYGGGAVKPLQVHSLVSAYSVTALTFITRGGQLTRFL